MNIKKSSWMMLGLVLGVSVILYIFDVPIVPSSTQMIPTIIVPTLVPTIISLPTGNIVQPTASLISPTLSPSIVNSFSANVDYFPEGRSESISVSLKLNGAVVSELSMVNSMNDGKSRMYQLAFESEIQPLVVGKDIKSLNLSRVAGASITTDAFMQAIDKIKSQI